MFRIIAFFIISLFARWYVWVGILTLFACWYVWVGILTLFIHLYVWVGILTLFARWYVWVGILTLFARWYVWVGILTLFARWYVWVGILLTRENHLHDYIISLKMDVLAHKTNLTPPYFIQVPLPRQESVRLCICVSVVSISLHSTSLLMDFCNVTTVSYFLFII